MASRILCVMILAMLAALSAATTLDNPNRYRAITLTSDNSNAMLFKLFNGASSYMDLDFNKHTYTPIVYHGALLDELVSVIYGYNHYSQSSQPHSSYYLSSTQSVNGQYLSTIFLYDSDRANLTVFTTIQSSPKQINNADNDKVQPMRALDNLARFPLAFDAINGGHGGPGVLYALAANTQQGIYQISAGNPAVRSFLPIAKPYYILGLAAVSAYYPVSNHTGFFVGVNMDSKNNPSGCIYAFDFPGGSYEQLEPYYAPGANVMVSPMQIVADPTSTNFYILDTGSFAGASATPQFLLYNVFSNFIKRIDIPGQFKLIDPSTFTIDSANKYAYITDVASSEPSAAAVVLQLDLSSGQFTASF